MIMDSAPEEPMSSIMSVASPARPASSSGTGALSLKEQNTRVNALTKENFDLKLKITFLEDTIRTRSDDGVQELVKQSAQLQIDLIHERKETQSMRRKIRNLEQQVQQQERDLAQAAARAQHTDNEDPDDPVLHHSMHEEILYLRQQIYNFEDTVTTLREDLSTKEFEKRKMADQLRTMADKRNKDSTGTKASADVWQGLLEAETSRREQAEDAANMAKNELHTLQVKVAAMPRSRFPRDPPLSPTRRPSRSRSTSRPRGDDDPERILIDEMVQQHENAELQQQNTELKNANDELKRNLSAQTSMLTSRYREIEVLQQKIEDLQLSPLNGTRSVAGESIFERSISRAHHRSQSRATDHTAITETERDDFHKKEGALRDQLAELRIKYQELDRQHKTYLQYVAAIEGDFKVLETDFDNCQQDCETLQKERDDAINAYQDYEEEHVRLKEDALAEINALDQEKTELEHKLDETHTKLQKTQSKLQSTADDYKGLQGELRSITQSVMNLEDVKKQQVRQIESLEHHVADVEEENQKWEEKCTELRTKNRQLEVTQESLHSEVTFLREEQEGDKIKIGELEHSLDAAHQTVQDEKEKLRELEQKMVEERQQRDVLEDQSKEEVQKILDDLNTDGQKKMDEVRRLRRDLSAKEVESSTYKQRLDDLEQSLRDILGEPNGTKHSMLGSIEKLQRELETTLTQLDKVKMDLSDRDRLLRHRDGLLENTSLESKRLSDLLDRERASRKREAEQFDKSSRGTAQQLRTIAQHETRIMELETLLTQSKRKADTLEQRYQDQLQEGHNLLLALWNRLSTLCGSDWAQNHALVDGELPSADVIRQNLPAFNKNIISAVKTIEALIGSFKVRIRSVEKDLFRDYQTLEHNLDIRIRRMDLLENAIDETQKAMAEEAAQRPQLSRAVSTKSVKNTEELNKLKTEVKHLKTELKFHRQHPSAMAQQMLHQYQQSNPDHARHQSTSSGKSSASPARQIVSQLLRHHSTSAVEQLSTANDSASSLQQIPIPTPLSQPGEQRWVHRLKEMERRLKAEREARLLDRRGARQRLEQAGAENEELREALERVRADSEVNEEE